MSNEEGKINDRQIDKIRAIARSIELLLSIADANLGGSCRLDNRRTPRTASARFSPSQDNVFWRDRNLDELLATECDRLKDYFVTRPEETQKLKVCK